MAASVNRDAPAEARGARATCCSAASIALRPARANVISSGSRSCPRRSVPVGSQKFAVSFLRRGVRAEKKPREPWTGPFTHTASRAMTRTRRADSAQPARDTADSTKQLKDTKRHLPGKSKLPRARRRAGAYPRRTTTTCSRSPKHTQRPPTLTRPPFASSRRANPHTTSCASRRARGGPRASPSGPAGAALPSPPRRLSPPPPPRGRRELALPTQPGSFGTRGGGAGHVDRGRDRTAGGEGSGRDTT